MIWQSENVLENHIGEVHDEQLRAGGEWIDFFPAADATIESTNSARGSCEETTRGSEATASITSYRL